MHNTTEVRPHPQGGYTVAVPVPGTCAARVYVGQYSDRAEARAALREMAHTPALEMIGKPHGRAMAA